MTYLLLQLILKFDELVKELSVNVLYAAYALIMNLSLHVFFGDFLAQLFGTVDSFESLTLLESRCVDILFLCQGEREDAIKQSLQKLVQFFLLIREQRFVNDIRNEFFLQNDEGVKIADLVETIKKNCPCRLEYFDKNVIVDVGHEMGHLVMCQVESMEFGLQVSTKSTELLLI